MQRWEYAELLWGVGPAGGAAGGPPARGTVWFTHREGTEPVADLRAVLHRLGEDGWELVAVTAAVVSATVARHYAFKRPLRAPR